MLLDKQFQLADINTKDAANDTLILHDSFLDLREANRGGGETLKIFGRVTTAFTAGTGCTFQIETSADTVFDTATILQSTRRLITEMDTVADNVYLGTVPYRDMKRYLGVRYVIDGTANGNGTIDMYVVLDDQTNTVDTV